MKDFAKVVPPEWGLVLHPRRKPVGSQVALVVKNLPANAGGRRDLGWENKKEREAWVGKKKRPGFDPWVGKIPMEEETATHSSLLAWSISWMEEPGGLQSTGSQRVNTTDPVNFGLVLVS